MRSLLHLPIHDPAAWDAARSGIADAVVLDLTASGEGRIEGLSAEVRTLIVELQEGSAPPQIFLRVEAVEDPGSEAALAAAVDAGLDGIVLADCRSGADVQHLGARLAVHEAERGVEDGTTSIIAVVSRATALLSLGTYPGCSARLIGLGWDAEHLAADLGLATGLQGALPPPLATARHLVLFAARAAEVAAIDAATASSDEAAVLDASRDTRRTGFNAKMTRTAVACAAVETAFGDEVEAAGG